MTVFCQFANEVWPLLHPVLMLAELILVGPNTVSSKLKLCSACTREWVGCEPGYLTLDGPPSFLWKRRLTFCRVATRKQNSFSQNRHMPMGYNASSATKTSDLLVGVVVDGLGNHHDAVLPLALASVTV